MPGVERKMTGGHGGAFWGEGHILYLDCGGGYMTTFAKAQKHTLKEGIAHLGIVRVQTKNENHIQKNFLFFPSE